MEQPVLSRDGSTSAFWSSASNLDPTKVSDEHEVFVHLRSTDTVVRLPLAEGQVAPWRGAQLAISADGLTIAYLTEAATEATNDLWLARLATSGEILSHEQVVTSRGDRKSTRLKSRP